MHDSSFVRLRIFLTTPLSLELPSAVQVRPCSLTGENRWGIEDTYTKTICIPIFVPSNYSNNNKSRSVDFSKELLAEVSCVFNLLKYPYYHCYD